MEELLKQIAAQNARLIEISEQTLANVQKLGASIEDHWRQLEARLTLLDETDHIDAIGDAVQRIEMAVTELANEAITQR